MRWEAVLYDEDGREVARSTAPAAPNATGKRWRISPVALAPGDSLALAYPTPTSMAKSDFTVLRSVTVTEFSVEPVYEYGDAVRSVKYPAITLMVVAPSLPFADWECIALFGALPREALGIWKGDEIEALP